MQYFSELAAEIAISHALPPLERKNLLLVLGHFAKLGNDLHSEDRRLLEVVWLSLDERYFFFAVFFETDRKPAEELVLEDEEIGHPVEIDRRKDNDHQILIIKANLCF